MPHRHERPSVSGYDPTELCAKAFRMALLAFFTALLGVVPQGIAVAKYGISAFAGAIPAAESTVQPPESRK